MNWTEQTKIGGENPPANKCGALRQIGFNPRNQTVSGFVWRSGVTGGLEAAVKMCF
jgi:hypothetical protein